MRQRVAWAMVLAVAACGREGSTEPRPVSQLAEQRGVPSGATLVARVNGVPITAAEVEAVSSGAALPRKQALERLVVARLLAMEARRRGYDRSPGVERAARSAAVHLLLEKAVEGTGRAAGRHALADAGPMPTERADEEVSVDSARAARLQALLAEARQRVGVTYEESTIQRAFRAGAP